MKIKLMTGALLAALSGVAAPYAQAEELTQDDLMDFLTNPETSETAAPAAEETPAQPETTVAPAPADKSTEEQDIEQIINAALTDGQAAPEAEGETTTTQETAKPAEDEGETTTTQETAKPAEDEGETTTTQETAKPEPSVEPVVTASVESLTPSERVLSKPGVSLYTDTDEASKSADYLPNYSILTVMDKQDGWLQVSTKTKGDAAARLAWVKERDVLPWKHQLVACFAAPQGRQRVLFFNSKEEALRLSALPAEERTAELKKIYDALDKGEEVSTAGVIATEPDGWAEMHNNFYLLPITDYTEDDSEFGEEFGVQAIQVSAATENTENAADIGNTRGMELDLVFVIDLSRSMNPVKDQVLSTIRKIAEAVKSNPQFKEETVHFGLWGYRDDTELCKGIEYVTKDYTAEGLLAAGDFISVLEKATATEVDSIDYAEDVLAGVKDAVQKTQWRGDAAKTIILIGDAPGRERGKTDPFSKRKDKPVGTAAEMNIPEIVALAQENQVEIGTLYLNVAKHAQYLPLGRQQFSQLATKTQEQATTVVDVTTQDDFQSFAHEVVLMLVAQVQQSSVNKKEILPSTEAQKFSTSLFRNAKVRWLARHHKVGVTPEMSGWILDKDLMDYGLDSVTPCVLLNRAQLDQMHSLLKNVIEAGKKAKGSNTAFLKNLQTVSVAGAADADLLDDVHTLADSRFVPTFLKELPYKSSVMTLTDEYWNAMNASEQDKVIQDAESKLQFYAEMYENADVWMAPDENSDADSKVVAIPLSKLP